MDIQMRIVSIEAEIERLKNERKVYDIKMIDFLLNIHLFIDVT